MFRYLPQSEWMSRFTHIPFTSLRSVTCTGTDNQTQQTDLVTKTQKTYLKWTLNKTTLSKHSSHFRTAHASVIYLHNTAQNKTEQNIFSVMILIWFDLIDWLIDWLIKVNFSYPLNGHHWTDIGLLREHYWEERFYTRLHWLQI